MSNNIKKIDRNILLTLVLHLIPPTYLYQVVFNYVTLLSALSFASLLGQHSLAPNGDAGSDLFARDNIVSMSAT